MITFRGTVSTIAVAAAVLQVAGAAQRRPDVFLPPSLDLGCGPPAERAHEYRITTHDHTPPLTAPPDKALVVVLYLKPRVALASLGRFHLGLNGRWAGALDMGQFSTFALEPGSVRYCWSMPGSTEISAADFGFLRAEAGRTYYLVGNYPRGIVAVDEQKWRGLQAECQCRHATSEDRGR
jgi:hypothetical protein